jgi:hypothetical protein
MKMNFQCCHRQLLQSETKLQILSFFFAQSSEPKKNISFWGKVKQRRKVFPETQAPRRHHKLAAHHNHTTVNRRHGDQQRSHPRAHRHRLTPELRSLLAALITREDVDVDEQEIVGVLDLPALSASGLLHYPSPLLGRLLSDLPELFELHVLPLLDSEARATFALTSRTCRDAVRGSRNFTPPGEPKRLKGFPLEVLDFVNSPERLAWARRNGVPWTLKTAELAVRGPLVPHVYRWEKGRTRAVTSPPCSGGAVQVEFSLPIASKRLVSTLTTMK